MSLNKESGIIRGLKRLAVRAAREANDSKAMKAYSKAIDSAASGGSTKGLSKVRDNYQKASSKLYRNKRLQENMDKKSIPSKIKKGLSKVHETLVDSFNTTGPRIVTAS